MSTIGNRLQYAHASIPRTKFVETRCEMKLVVLGSGTSVPHAKRASPSYWLETSGGIRMLLDAGADAPHRMAEEELDWPNLDVIWISHYHWDHFAGLLALLFGMKWATQTENRTAKLTILGGKSLRHLLERINEANSFKLFDQRFPIEILEVNSADKIELASDVSARVMPTPHTKESLALRITDAGGKTLVYTSDTAFCDELIPFCSGANLLLMECSFRKNKPSETHLELADAMRIAAACRPDRVVLTHLYPEWDQFNVVAEAQRLWQGQTIEATDGLKLMI
ncbi:MAG TPA: ribonuclease Z [Pyrinomonadaceae bacterium]|nr:ribonuclease Z [Pyrinomonadaceae bacterium]